MADDPQRRHEEDRNLDVRIDDASREGLVGSARGDVYAGEVGGERITVAPDLAPMEAQPRWRRDFPIDWPEDHYVARRDFARFLVLISGAFVAGQGWIAAQDLVRKNRRAAGRARIASLADVPVGTATMFAYPGEHDTCLLVRLGERDVVAFSQKCTHLSCAVVPRIDEGVFHCPCHEGFFDLRTGRNIAGPPPRPLPAIELELDGDDVYAVGVRNTTV